MPRTTITLPNELLDELMSEVGAKSRTRAVVMAIEDEIRLRKLKRIKAMAGHMEFTSEAEDLRHRDRRLG